MFAVSLLPWKTIRMYAKYVSVALVIQHAKRMRHIVLSSVACLAVPYFPHYLINGTAFGRRYL